MLRRSKDEIRLNYVYFGEAIKRELAVCDEGELHWLGRDELFARPMSALNELVLERWLAVGPEKDVTVGTLTEKSGVPAIDWLPLTDWEGI